MNWNKYKLTDECTNIRSKSMTKFRSFPLP